MSRLYFQVVRWFQVGFNPLTVTWVSGNWSLVTGHWSLIETFPYFVILKALTYPLSQDLGIT